MIHTNQTPQVKRLCALDVQYGGHEDALAAACLFDAWGDASAYDDYRRWIAKVEPYQSGQFSRRELPCLLAVLALVKVPLSHILVDGYVDLDTGPGLGRRLFDALREDGREGPVVVGVAKRPYAGAPALPVYRGVSRVPLWVSAAGMDVEEAAQRVQAMAGEHRIPMLLKYVNRRARGLS